MRRAPAFLLALAAMAAVARATEPPTPVPPPPGPFNLTTCYELAVLRSETLGLREEDVRVAQARYWQALGGILPQIHSLTEQDLQNKAGFPATSGSGSGAGKDRFTTRIHVAQPLFQGFREFNAAAAARADIETQKQTAKRFRQTLYRDVADVFYQILMFEGDLRVLAEVEEALDQRIVELGKRVRLGKSRSSELLAAQTDLASTRVLVEQARGLLGASRELLAFLTGLKAEMLKLKDTQKAPTAEALEAFLGGAGERPDILAAIEAERSATRQLSVAKGGHWPTIAVEGDYYLKQHPQSPLTWDIALTCDLPLFEGGIIEAQVREQKARLRQSTLSLEQIRRESERDVRTAYNDFIAASAQWLRLEEACKISSQNYDLQQQDYRLGISNNLDVLTALRQMEEARRQRYDAEMQMRTNLIRLHVAAGDFSPVPPKP